MIEVQLVNIACIAIDVDGLYDLQLRRIDLLDCCGNTTYTGKKLKNAQLVIDLAIVLMLLFANS